MDADASACDEGHVPGAIAWSWKTELCDTVRRDILSQEQFQELMRSSAVANDTAPVLYGDNNDWLAAWAFWQARIYKHRDGRLMNGGRKKWLAEGRDLSREVPVNRLPPIRRPIPIFPYALSCRGSAKPCIPLRR